MIDTAGNPAVFFNRPAGKLFKKGSCRFEKREGKMDNTLNMLCSSSEVQGAVRQLAADIFKLISSSSGECALVGIHQQGVPLACAIKEVLEKEFKCSPDLGTLDISMYRDDIGNRSRLPLIRETSIPFDVNDKLIILVDDVLSSGRTIRAALDALTDYGRPRLIRLAVLVDRGEPEFPIRADFVGFNLTVPAGHKIKVLFAGDSSEEPGIYDMKWQK